MHIKKGKKICANLWGMSTPIIKKQLFSSGLGDSDKLVTNFVDRTNVNVCNSVAKGTVSSHIDYQPFLSFIESIK
jgi:hypothetical protein